MDLGPGFLAYNLQIGFMNSGEKTRGRPTKSDWCHNPKIPMSDATKAHLMELARQNSESGAKIGYTQVGAFALEEYLANMSRLCKSEYEGTQLPSVVKAPTHIQKILEAVRYSRDRASLLIGFENLNSEEWYCAFLDALNNKPWLHEIGVQFALEGNSGFDVITEIVKKLGNYDRVNAMKSITRLYWETYDVAEKRKYKMVVARYHDDIMKTIDPGLWEEEKEEIPLGVALKESEGYVKDRMDKAKEGVEVSPFFNSYNAGAEA